MPDIIPDVTQDDLVPPFDTEASGMCSTTKEVSAIKRAPREAGRTGHAAAPLSAAAAGGCGAGVSYENVESQRYNVSTGGCRSTLCGPAEAVCSGIQGAEVAIMQRRRGQSLARAAGAQYMRRPLAPILVCSQYRDIRYRIRY